MPDDIIYPSHKPPWWVQFIYVAGVPAAMALFMLWFITDKIDDNLTEIRNSAMETAKQTAVMAERLNTGTYQNNFVINSLDTILKLQEQTCLNTATNDIEIKRCRSITN